MPIESIEDTHDASDLFDFGSLVYDQGLISTDSTQSAISSVDASITALDDYTSSGSWFLAPESFVIDHTTIAVPPNFEMSDLKSFVNQIQQWLVDWTKEGSNGFIHEQLYRDKFPSSVSIAFTTYSAYVNRTPATSDTVLRCANDRATELVTAIATTPVDSLGVIDILAQTHALMTYQIIGLLDGDFRSRAIAQERCQLFRTVLGRLHAKASTEIRQALMESEINDITRGAMNPSTTLLREWQAWVLSESVRRTWLLGTGFHAAYEGLTFGWTTCGGDLPLSMRKGLWDAKGPHAWSKLCLEKDVRFLGRFGAAWLFGTPPDEVDEFARMMLEITYGADRMAAWLAT